MCFVDEIMTGYNITTDIVSHAQASGFWYNMCMAEKNDRLRRGGCVGADGARRAAK